MLLRVVPVIVLIGCFPDDDDDEDPPGVCGNGVVERGEQCDDGNPNSATCSPSCQTVETYTVHWRTSSVSGAEHSCPAGFDRADVIVQPATADGDCFPELSDCAFTTHDSPTVFTSPCADGAARVQMPPPLTYAHEGYRVSVRFATSSTNEIYGETLSTWLTEVTDATMYEDSGYARVRWDLRSATGAALDCAMADIADVTIIATEATGVVLPVTLTVPCTKLSAFTPPLVAADYNLELTTRRASATRGVIAIGRRSAVTDPGPIMLTMP
jgi:cysteine-rich repeat protein